MTSTTDLRIRVLDERPVREDGAFVLYWMTAARRLEWNFGLDRAIELAREAGRPLVILEALRVAYPWASDRHHVFAMQGMAEHSARLSDSPILYYPYVEPEAGAGSGLLEALAERACALVTDWSPAFFLPRMIRAAARKTSIRFEAVDSLGLLPLAAAGRPFTAAYHFRRFLQKTLPDHLKARPAARPVDGLTLDRMDGFPEAILERWPPASPKQLQEPESLAGALPIDHSVPPVSRRGGRTAAFEALDAFLRERLHRYGDHRNSPDRDAASGLSPWLHWGHLSAHEVFARVVESEGWTQLRLSARTDGKRVGWWGLSEAAESFLDELITWRELGHVFCEFVPDYDRYESLPAWAIESLETHASDPRPHVYTLEEFDRAETHDSLWNAAQRQLREDGVIHNYLRMLWGKKILEWSIHPRVALDIMVELNNRYAIDGRDPNSYAGIFWVLGRFDRGWPERAVFGKVRSMSSERTAKKVQVSAYLDRWQESGQPESTER